jgi:clan AA aspartic protease
MRGSVSNLHALLPITFRLPGRPDFTIEFVVDTGFTGFLTLPVPAIATMGLPFLHWTFADLADDSSIQLPVHTATILWNGTVRQVRVLGMGRRPLLGTALLLSRAQHANDNRLP